MPNNLDLKARLILAGPPNAKPVVNALQRQLSNIKVDIKLKIDTRAATQLDALSKRVDKLNAALKSANISAIGFDSTIKRIGTSFARLSEIRQTSANLTTFEKRVTSARKATEGARNEIENFGKQAALAIRRFSAFTVAVGAVFGFIRAIQSATSEAIAFDKQLTKIAQVTGLSKKNLAPLTAEITRLSTTLGVSSTELVDVAQTLAQAGLSATNTKRALEALAKSSLAPSFSDIKNTTEAAIAAMAQFNIEARELDDVLGSINSVAAAFATEAEDLTKVIRISGGAFVAAGSKLEEPKNQLNELLALFTAVRSTTRVSAENIATGFNTIFSRLQRPAAIEFLRNFNIELTDAEGRFVGVYEAVQRLNRGLNQFQTGDLQFAAIIEQLGGFRQVKNVIPLIQQAGKAQQALSIAQDKNRNLTKDQIIAQESLANAISRVKEEFLAFVRGLTETGTFQATARGLLAIASAAIRVAETLKPVLPIIAVLTGAQLARTTFQFAGGFFKELGAFKGTQGGAAGAVGGGIAKAVTGTTERSPSVIALNANTNELRKLTSTISILARSLVATAGIGRIRRAGGGKITGPGTSSSDSIIASVSDGEYIIQASSARKIGTAALDQMNKTGHIPAFASGGPIGVSFGNPGSNILPFARKFEKEVLHFVPFLESASQSLIKFFDSIEKSIAPIQQRAAVTPPISFGTRKIVRPDNSFKPGLIGGFGPRGSLPNLNIPDLTGQAIDSRLANVANTLGPQSNLNVRQFTPRTILTPGQLTQIQRALPPGSSINPESFNGRTTGQRQASVTLSTNLLAGAANARARQDSVNVGIASLLSGPAPKKAFSKGQRDQAIAKQVRLGFSPQQAAENVDNIFAGAFRKQAAREATREQVTLGTRLSAGITTKTPRIKVPLTQDQLNARFNRRLAIGGAATTAGFIAAGALEGRGAAGSAAASGLSGGLLAGGLATSIAGGPVGAVVGVTTGVVAALDTFLKETNRLAIEAKEIDFKNTLEGLEKELKNGTANIAGFVSRGNAATAEKRNLQNSPFRSIDAFFGTAFSQSFQGLLPGRGTRQFARSFGQATGLSRSESDQLAGAGFTSAIGGSAKKLSNIIFGTNFDVLSAVKENKKVADEQAKEDAKQLVEPILVAFKKEISRGTSTASGILGRTNKETNTLFGTAGINLGKELFDAQKIRDSESALNRFRLTISRLADDLQIAANKTQANNTVLRDRIDQENELSRSISGGSLGGNIRTNGRFGSVLGNISGFSANTVQGTLNNLQRGGLSGAAANTIRSFRTVDTQIPQILKSLNVATGNPQDVIRDFNRQVNATPLTKEIRDVLIKSFDDALNTEDIDFDIKKAIRDFNPNQELGGLRDASFNEAKAVAERLEIINQRYTDSVTDLISAQEAYRTKLLESIDIETNAREKIAEVTGGSRLGALNAGLVARNTALGASPTGLGTRIARLQERGGELRNLISTAANPTDAAFFGNQLLQVNDELTRAKAALEIFSNDTLKASIAAEKLSKAEEKRSVGREIAGNLLGSNRLGFFRQVQALERFQGGDLRTLSSNFEDVQAGVSLQAKFLRATGREGDAIKVERNFENALAKALGSPELAKLFTDSFKEEDEAKKLQKEAAELQIKAAQETIIAQKSIVSFFSAKAGIVPRAGGGAIYGAGTSTSDSIPARVSNGEFIIKASSARKIGTGNLQRMNQTGQIPGNTGNPFVDIPANIIEGTKQIGKYFGFAAGGRPTYAQIKAARRQAYVQGKNNRRRAYIQGKIDRANAYFNRRRGNPLISSFLRNPRDLSDRQVRTLRRFYPNIRNIDRLRKRYGFAEGGPVITNGNGGGGNFGLDSASIAMIGSFNQAANNLAQSLASVNFPQTISMSGTHNVNVTLNGAAVLQNLLNGPLAGIIQGAIEDALAKYDRELKT